MEQPVVLAEDQESANKWVVLVLAAVGAFMTTLDASIVNISLPSIAHSFGVPLSGAIEWIIIGYLVIIAAVLLTFGRLADMIGRKPIWLAGLAIFTIGSALSGHTYRRSSLSGPGRGTHICCQRRLAHQCLSCQ